MATSQSLIHLVPYYPLSSSSFYTQRLKWRRLKRKNDRKKAAFVFVWWRQTIVWSHQTIVCSRQTIVWQQQTINKQRRTIQKNSAEARTKEICPLAGAPNVPPHLSSASTMQRKSITGHTKTTGNRELTSEKRLLALPKGRFSTKASSEISGKESPQQKKSEQSIWQTKNSFYLCTRLTAIR